MKQVYEASDITWDDKVHAFLMGEALIAAIALPAKVEKSKKDGTDPGDAMKSVAAEMLNRASEAGISITVCEVPSVFRGAK